MGLSLHFSAQSRDEDVPLSEPDLRNMASDPFSRGKLCDEARGPYHNLRLSQLHLWIREFQPIFHSFLISAHGVHKE